MPLEVVAVPDDAPPLAVPVPEVAPPLAEPTLMFPPAPEDFEPVDVPLDAPPLALPVPVAGPDDSPDPPHAFATATDDPSTATQRSERARKGIPHLRSIQVPAVRAKGSRKRTRRTAAAPRATKEVASRYSERTIRREAAPHASGG